MLKIPRLIFGDPLRKKSFRRMRKLINDALWPIAALMWLFVVIFGGVWMAWIAFLFSTYCAIVSERQRWKLIREEKRVIDCLADAANFNIRAAKYSAQYGTKHPHKTLYTALSLNFGPGFMSSLRSHHMGWVKERYDEIIEKITEEDLLIERTREALQSIGDAEQRQLEAYYRGKKELREDYRPEGNFDWSEL